MKANRNDQLSEMKEALKISASSFNGENWRHLSGNTSLHLAAGMAKARSAMAAKLISWLAWLAWRSMLMACNQLSNGGAMASCLESWQLKHRLTLR